jgi:toxin ParE1/3/4
MKLIFTDGAKADLRSIALNIARDNISRAKSFSKELRTSCRKLSEHPLRFASVSGHINVRKRVHGNYVIFYRVNDVSIDILHIRHGSMEVEDTDFD